MTITLGSKTRTILSNIWKDFQSYIKSSTNEDVSSPLTRWQIFLYILLLLVTIGLSLRNYDAIQIGVVTDDASYSVLAYSIAFSNDYGLMNVPGDPLPTRYPFGFPLLISPLAKAFPETPSVMRYISLLATLVNTSLLFWGWKYISRDNSRWRGLAIAALYSTSTLVIGLSRMVISEPIFTTFVLLALIAFEKNLSKNFSSKYYLLLLGVVMSFAFFVRTLGVLLWIIVAIRTLLTRNLKVLLTQSVYLLLIGIGLLSLIVILTPVTFTDLLPIEYSDQFNNPQSYGQGHVAAALIPRFFDALQEYVQAHLRDAVIPIGGGQKEIELGSRLGISNLPLITGLIIGSLILLGSLPLNSYQNLSPTVLLFEALYLGAILFWPWRGERFLYPILPFLFYQLISGIELILIQSRRIRAIPTDSAKQLKGVGVIAAISIILALSIFKGVTDNRSSLDYSRDLSIGATWLKENTAPDIVVMAQQPQSIYLYSQRKTVDYPNIFTLPELIDYLNNGDIDYIVIAPMLDMRYDGVLRYDNYTQDILLPVVSELVESGYLQLVFESKKDKVQVYRILK